MQEKKPPAGLAGMDLAPSKGKKKKTKAAGGGAPNMMDPFGMGGGMGGMNPYGFGGGLPGGQADPFADLMGGGINPMGNYPQPTSEQQQQQQRELEKQMKVFNEQMTQMFKDIPPPDPESQAKMQASMAETIKALSGQSGDGSTVNPDGSTKSLTTEEASMKAMIEAMSGGQDMQGVMDTMLQHLLSKDVLYEPMKDIAEKYPPWLKKNAKKIPDDELVRYESQLAKTKSIIAAFEDETVEHSVIVQLLQEMQAFGNPPQEIMKEMANAKGMKLGPNGMPLGWGGIGGGETSDGPKGMGGLGLGKGKKGGAQQGGPPPECVIM